MGDTMITLKYTEEKNDNFSVEDLNMFEAAIDEEGALFIKTDTGVICFYYDEDDKIFINQWGGGADLNHFVLVKRVDVKITIK